MARRARTVVGTIACVVACLQPLATSRAAEQAGQHDLEIARQPLARALQEFAKQSGVQIIFFSAVTAGREAPPLRGRFTTEAALEEMLDDSRLTFRQINSNTIEICLRTEGRHDNTAPEHGPSPIPERDMKNVESDSLKLAEDGARKRGLRRGLSISGAIMTAAAASAGAAEAGGPAALEEIVVTAQRRVETAQRTPLAITALSSDTLNEQGVTSAAALNAVVPNVQIGDAGSGNMEIFVRGIGSTNNTEVGDPALAFNVDGVYLARSRSAGGVFYDLERIEVLRGPQGTLYGRNATAGSINVITKKPVDAYEGSAQLEMGNYSLVRTAGVLNVPLSDTTAMRAAFQSQRRDGYTNNAPLRSDYNDEDTVAGRVHFLFEPTENLSVLLSGDYTRSGAVGSSVAPLGTAKRESDPYTFAVSEEGSRRQELYGATLTADWALPLGTVTYVGAYRRDDISWFNGDVDQLGGNATGSGVDNVVACDTSLGSASCRTATYYSDAAATSHELRIAADTDLVKWVAGLYYFNENNDVLFHLDPATGASLTFVQPQIDAESKAAFAQATFSMTDRLRLTGGARYTKDNKARRGGTFVGGTLVGDQFSGGNRIVLNIADIDWSSTDWKVGAEFDLTDASLLYTYVGTGYKAGGYGAGAPPIVYGPEELMAYEIGWKNRLFSDTVQANLTAFYYDYQDFQVSAIGQVAGQAALLTINADAAEVYGIELETRALITERDRIDFDLAYLHAEYTSFDLPCGDQFGQPVPIGYVPPAGCAPGPALRLPVSYTGNALAKSPEWSATLAYQHDWILNNNGKLTARLQTHYEAEKNLDYHNFALTQQDASTKTDLVLSYTTGEEKWTVMGYVRNIEDDEVLVYAQTRSNAPVSRTSGTALYALPRTYGVQLTARFW